MENKSIQYEDANNNIEYLKLEIENLKAKINELTMSIKTHEFNSAEAERFFPELIRQIEEPLKEEIERLRKALKEQCKINDAKENDPYWYWPQCDVEDCVGVSCSGGIAWNNTGYWSVCPKHSQDYRDGKPQPQMKQSAINREASRDKDGRLSS